MAVYFYLTIECGPDEVTALAVKQHFHGFSIRLAANLEVDCKVYHYQDAEDNWWVDVNPEGANYAGRPEVPGANSDENLSTIGFALYAHLRTSPPFRYAAYGAEPEQFRLFTEIDQDDFSRGIKGWVVATSVAQQFSWAECFCEFAPGYIWDPYWGEYNFNRVLALLMSDNSEQRIEGWRIVNAFMPDAAKRLNSYDPNETAAQCRRVVLDRMPL